MRAMEEFNATPEMFRPPWSKALFAYTQRLEDHEKAMRAKSRLTSMMLVALNSLVSPEIPESIRKIFVHRICDIGKRLYDTRELDHAQQAAFTEEVSRLADDLVESVAAGAARRGGDWNSIAPVIDLTDNMERTSAFWNKVDFVD